MFVLAHRRLLDGAAGCQPQSMTVAIGRWSESQSRGLSILQWTTRDAKPSEAKVRSIVVSPRGCMCLPAAGMGCILGRRRHPALLPTK